MKLKVARESLWGHTAASFIVATLVWCVRLVFFSASLAISCCMARDLFAKPLTIIRYGLVVRISGFHPGGSGSIPGIGRFHFAN